MMASPASVEWAIRSLDLRSDTDLFPRPAELNVLVAPGSDSVATIAGLDLAQHNPSAPRRFIVPKDDLSYRAATQLDPLDSIILTALVHEFGAGIEQHRIDKAEQTIFSYRFAPSPDGSLYSPDQSWNDYWSRCQHLSESYEYALVVDVADFYNQIYHHTLENQLAQCGFPNQAIQWILRLLRFVSANVSRGIPVGPHSTHLLAEASFIPIDNSLKTRGTVFARFVDDIVIFAHSEREAREYLYQVAEIMDKQQRLQLQRGKTKILTSEQLQTLSAAMIEDRAINDLERDLLRIIRRHSGGNPYRTVLLSSLTPQELRSFREPTVRRILDEYLAADETDFVRLRWFLRRLGQVGHPAAVSYCIEHIPQLTPALGDICHYLVGVSLARSPVDWAAHGAALLAALENELIQSNEYLQLSMLALFARETGLDHIARILQRFKASPPSIRREIILIAAAAGAADWLRELKEEVPAMDPWTKRAFLYSAKVLPREERRFFIRSLDLSGTLERLIAAWARD